jgi:hypothetical protein
MLVRLLVAGLVATVSLGASAYAGAQDVVADVKTWTGQVWRLNQPSLEVFYTIVPAAKDDAGGAPAPAGAAATGAGASTQGGSRGAMVFGTMKDLGSLMAPGPQTLQGRTTVESVTLTRSGAEMRVPLGSVASIAFSRQPVAESTLPPYLAGSHFRHGATVMLTDGSRVDADYVNLGTTVVRGMTPQGRVDLPWGDVETIRFQR